MPKNMRRGWIAVTNIAYEGYAMEDGTRVYFTKAAAEREAARITKSLRDANASGEVIELWIPKSR